MRKFKNPYNKKGGFADYTPDEQRDIWDRMRDSIISRFNEEDYIASAEEYADSYNGENTLGSISFDPNDKVDVATYIILSWDDRYWDSEYSDDDDDYEASVHKFSNDAPDTSKRYWLVEVEPDGNEYVRYCTDDRADAVEHSYDVEISYDWYIEDSTDNSIILDSEMMTADNHSDYVDSYVLNRVDEDYNSPYVRHPWQDKRISMSVNKTHNKRDNMSKSFSEQVKKQRSMNRGIIKSLPDADDVEQIRNIYGPQITVLGKVYELCQDPYSGYASYDDDEGMQFFPPAIVDGELSEDWTYNLRGYGKYGMPDPRTDSGAVNDFFAEVVAFENESFKSMVKSQRAKIQKH